MNNDLKHYEFTFIIPGNLPENEHPETLSKIKNLLEANRAQNIIVTLEIGRRKFAYPINKLRHGFYFVWEFNIAANDLLKTEQELKIHKDILRYLIIKKKIKTAEEITREEKIKAGRVKEQLAKEKEAAEAEEKKEKPIKSKVSLDDLDKKLDELLNEEIK